MNVKNKRSKVFKNDSVFHDFVNSLITGHVLKAHSEAAKQDCILSGLGWETLCVQLELHDGRKMCSSKFLYMHINRKVSNLI